MRAAEQKIELEQRRFKRRHPSCNGYLPRSIISVPPTGTYIERIARYSTAWAAA